MFLAVCDPEPPPEFHGDRRPNPSREPRDRMLDRREAADAARRGLREYGLYEREDWAGPLQRAKPSEPALVERLDRPGTYYYIVPMGASRDELTVAVNIDARTGDYMQAVSLPEPGPNHLPSLARDQVLEQVIEERIELPDLRGRIMVRPELSCVYPVLVCKPCRESLSPFYPFRMIT